MTTYTLGVGIYGDIPGGFGLM